jgi:TonB family protein
MKTIIAFTIALLVSFSCTAASQEGAKTVSPGVRAPGQQQVPDNVLVDSQPEIKKPASPVYPREALAKGLEGKVWVKILVDTAGIPAEVNILKSENDVFNESAMAAARQFTFAPALKDKKPVAVWVTMPFKFKLADKKEEELSTKAGEQERRIREELLPKVELVFSGDAAARTVISPEAYLVDGARFVNLNEALFGKEKGKTFEGESKRQASFMKIGLSEDGLSATMLMRTETAKKTQPHWHTITWVREKGGEWKITHWHASH